MQRQITTTQEPKGEPHKKQGADQAVLAPENSTPGTPRFLTQNSVQSGSPSDSQNNDSIPRFLNSQIESEIDSALNEPIDLSAPRGALILPTDALGDSDETIQCSARNKANGGIPTSDQNNMNNASLNKTGGLPLVSNIQNQLETVFEQDFSDVRVHQNADADHATESLAAKAFAHKNHIWLANDQSQFDLPLMAHETTHVLQQRTATPAIQRTPQGAGQRSADFSVAWTEDSQVFYHRVVNAAARNRGLRGVRRSNLYQPYYSLCASMHSRISRRTPIVPPGSRIQLRASIWFDPSAFHGQVSNASLEQLEEAVLRENRVTGILTPTATLSGGTPNRMGISETAVLSFSSNPAASAAAFGGLRWHVTSGTVTSLTGGDDGQANLTTGPAAGDVTLELRVEAGPTAGRVAASLTVDVVDWPVVGGRPGSAESTSAAMLDVTGGALQHTGTVTAAPGSTSGEITLTAPMVTYNATVALKPGVTLVSGTSIQVGPVQTVMSSERVAVYRRGGSPTGDIIAERQITAPRTRDAQFQDSPTGPVQDVVPPWYSRPAGATVPPSITNTLRSQPVNFRDQPSFDLPLGVGNGTLTETRGQDSFITSIVAIHNGNQVYLKSSSWSVPWDMTIASGGTATGNAVSSEEIRFGAPVTTGPIAVASTRDVLSFSSAVEASHASAETLLQHLEETRRHDAAAGAILEAGLRLKNPTFTLNLTVVKGSDWIPPENFDLTAQGHHTVSRPGFAVAQGSSVTITISFNSLFDSGRVGLGDAIDFQIRDVGLPVPQMSWPFPFNDATSPSFFTRGNGGEYTITGNLR